MMELTNWLMYPMATFIGSTDLLMDMLLVSYCLTATLCNMSLTWSHTTH